MVGWWFLILPFVDLVEQRTGEEEQGGKEAKAASFNRTHPPTFHIFQMDGSVAAKAGQHGASSVISLRGPRRFPHPS